MAASESHRMSESWPLVKTAKKAAPVCFAFHGIYLKIKFTETRSCSRKDNV